MDYSCLYQSSMAQASLQQQYANQQSMMNQQQAYSVASQIINAPVKKNNEVEEKEMVEKKSFGLKDATMVVFIAWIVSKLVSRWTGKTLEEFMSEYKSEFKEWLDK